MTFFDAVMPTIREATGAPMSPRMTGFIAALVWLIVSVPIWLLGGNEAALLFGVLPSVGILLLSLAAQVRHRRMVRRWKRYVEASDARHARQVSE